MYEANITDELLLGSDFLYHYGCLLNCRKLSLHIEGQELPCYISRNCSVGGRQAENLIFTTRKVAVPPNSSKVVMGQVQNSSGTNGIVFPLLDTPCLMTPHALVIVGDGMVPVQLDYPTVHEVYLHKDDCL